MLKKRCSRLPCRKLQVTSGHGAQPGPIGHSAKSSTSASSATFSARYTTTLAMISARVSGGMANIGSGAFRLRQDGRQLLRELGALRRRFSVEREAQQLP